MNYTKGEWRVELRPADNVRRIYCEPIPEIIADVFGTNAEDEGNAHLIAAAPNCYEELKEADRVICQLCKRLNPQHASSPYNEGCEWCQDREDRLQALAKAEGRQ